MWLLRVEAPLRIQMSAGQETGTFRGLCAGVWKKQVEKTEKRKNGRLLPVIGCFFRSLDIFPTQVLPFFQFFTVPGII